jgi:biopolymer transport protein ExbD
MVETRFQPNPSEVAESLRALSSRWDDGDGPDGESPSDWDAVQSIGTPELNVVPLIDVLFLLMIFFVISGTFALGEGILASRMLPAGASSTGVPLPFSPILVEFRMAPPGSGRVEIRVAGKAEPMHSMPELTVALLTLRSTAGFDHTTPIVIKSDDEVPWDAIAGGWNAAVRAGFHDIGFVAKATKAGVIGQ